MSYFDIDEFELFLKYSKIKKGSYTCIITYEKYNYSYKMIYGDSNRLEKLGPDYSIENSIESKELCEKVRRRMIMQELQK
jgi:hypothetical protein